MIPRSNTIKLTETWQNQLKSLIQTPEQLVDVAELPQSILPALKAGHALFPIRTTQSFAHRINTHSSTPLLDDPILQQIMPVHAETLQVKGYSADPLQEMQTNPIQGVIHKYHGRVLLIGASQCAINCRYCFRRHFDYQANSPSQSQWRESLDYIRQHTDITEVILSGGDPLIMGDRQLQWLIDEIAAIEHVDTVRVHSRIPIVLPSRITPELLDIFDRTRLKNVWVIHANHAQELSEEVRNALQLVRKQNIHLLNQSVLLKGINNHPQTLVHLSRSLFECGILPYYLHLLDKVNGAAHFDVMEQQAIKLVNAMRHQLPGYLVPTLVKEVPGAQSKVPVGV